MKNDDFSKAIEYNLSLSLEVRYAELIKAMKWIAEGHLKHPDAYAKNFLQSLGEFPVEPMPIEEPEELECLGMPPPGYGIQVVDGKIVAWIPSSGTYKAYNK